MYWNSNQVRVFSLSVSVSLSLSFGKHTFRIDILYFRATINVENHKFYTYTATTGLLTDIYSLAYSLQLSKYSYTTEYNQIPMNMKVTTEEPTSFRKLTDGMW